MKYKTTIVEVTDKNIADHPQAICFINPKHEHYHKKVDWYKKEFKNGLKIKLLYIKEEKKPVGYIEFVPGEHCWRAVRAENYMFIHCLWTTGKKYQHQGLGTLLLKDVEEAAKDKSGVVAITSDKAFMAGKEIFMKNGYQTLAESGKDQLMVKPFREGPLPSFNDWESELAKYQGLTIIYSKQCPWVARFIEEVKPILEEKQLKPTIIELRNAGEAQHAPSLYSVFNLIYEGKLLADRYVSTTRFKNIIEKELPK